MKSKYLLVIPILFVLASIAACKKNSGVDFHYDYFPVNEGKYVIYHVKDISIDVNAIVKFDTTEYYIKALIGDTIIDNEGRVARRYERWFGTSANGPWNLVDIWTTVVSNGKAELVEENARKIKMVFAPTETKEWNLNAYNTETALNCYYSELHVPYSVNGYAFDSTVTVLQQYVEPNLIEYKNKYERYAKGVGMIQKVFVEESHNNFDTTQVTKAKKVYMNLVSHGQQ